MKHKKNTLVTDFYATNKHTGKISKVKKLEIINDYHDTIVFELDDGDRWSEQLFNEHFLVEKIE